MSSKPKPTKLRGLKMMDYVSTVKLAHTYMDEALRPDAASQAQRRNARFAMMYAQKARRLSSSAGERQECGLLVREAEQVLS